MKKFKYSIFAAAFTSLSANAVEINEDQRNAIYTEIQSRGSAPIVLNIFKSTLNDLYNNKSALKTKSNTEIAAIVSELGDGILPSSVWTNNLGQAGLYVTKDGFEKLLSSTKIIDIWLDTNWINKTSIIDSDGALADLNENLRSGGNVNVEVFLNVDSLEFKIDTNGNPLVTNSLTSAGQANELAANILLGKSSKIAKKNMERSLVADSITKSGTIVLQASLDDVIALSRDPSVRAIRRVGYRDSRPISFDKDAIAKAKAEGEVEVGITVATPLWSSSISQASQNNMRAARAGVLPEIFSNLKISKTPKKSLPEYGTFYYSLTADELLKLQNSKDARIRHIGIAKAVAKPTLSDSKYTLNLPQAWAAGFRGAGQNIAIFDSGLEKFHNEFKDDSGVSRVIYEGCFGTDQTAFGRPYKSTCPEKGTQGAGPGDSPDGLTGSGGVLTSEYCFPANACEHGTHVAGIAAGRAGVAPSATISSIRMSSYDSSGPTSNLGFHYFDSDILAALQKIRSLVLQSGNNSYTINMSIGGSEVHSEKCTSNSWTAIASAVSELRNLGVPVVTATGNEGKNYGISFPACIPRTIKVSSLYNFGPNNSPLIASSANYMNLANEFPGEYMFFAPGEFVTSAIPGVSAFGAKRGTSMAAPQISGIFALAKAGVPGATVDDISVWLYANSVWFNAPACTNLTTCQSSVHFRSARLPNL